MDKTEAEIQAAQQLPRQARQPATVGEPVEPQTLQFIHDGRQRLTLAVNALRALREWADSYDNRGGAAVFGPDAAEVHALNNDLQGAFNPAKRAIFSRLRTDI